MGCCQATGFHRLVSGVSVIKPKLRRAGAAGAASRQVDKIHPDVISGRC